MNTKTINAARKHRDRLKSELIKVVESDRKKVSSKCPYRNLTLSDIAVHIRICTLISQNRNMRELCSLIDGLSSESARVLPVEIYFAELFLPPRGRFLIPH